VVNASGLMAIGMDLQGPGTIPATNLGMFLGTGANDLELVIRKGDPVPGGPAGWQVASALFPSLNDSGLLLFTSTFTGPGTNSANNMGLLVRRPGSTAVEPFVLAGDPTPDVPGQVMARPLSGRVNNAGQFLLTAGVAGAGVVEDLNEVARFFGTSPQSLFRVAQANDPAPGLPPGIRHGFMGNPTLTQDGGVAFDSQLSSGIAGQVNTSNDTAVFAGTSAASITLLMREGDTAPVPGRTDLTYSGPPGFHTSSGGNVVVTSRLGGPPNAPRSGVFVGTVVQGLSAVALEGARAPGTPANVRFRDAFSDPAFTRAAINAHGQAAFAASVGTNTTNLQDALYFFDPEQGLILIARAGGTMEVKPGVTKTVSFVDLARPGNGQNFGGGPLDDDGTVAYQASFTDGTTGIFTATIPLVGDVNVDKVVSFGDFQALERGFGSTDATRAMGDLNGDLVVDFADFLLLYNHFGERVGGPAAPMTPAERAGLDAFAAAHVPEPGLGFAGLAAMGWVLGGRGQARRRR